MIEDESQETTKQLLYLRAIKNVLDRKVLILSLLILSLPFTTWAAHEAWYSNTNEVADWLPETLQATQDLKKFMSKFGSDELLMIRWDGCSLEDPRIEEFRRQLVQEVATPTGKVALFRDVLTGPKILDSFQSPPLAMDRQEALEKMKGWILSDDGQSTCLIALVSEQGVNDSPAAVEQVYDVADKIEGISRDSIYVGGPTIQGVAIDHVSQEFLMELNLASYGICLVILVGCLRSIRASLLVYLIALFNEQVSMSLVILFRETMDSVLLLTANLTFVITISIGIHLVNYYREALQTKATEFAPAWACLMALKPTFLATTTTALGLASLMISELRPISRFGFYSSISIVFAAMSTMVLIGVHFSAWPLKRRSQSERSHLRDPFMGWTAILRSLRWPIVVMAILGMVLGLYGMKFLRTSVGLHQLISSEHPIIADYNHLERQIGPLTPIEIVLEAEAVPGKERSDARTMLNQFRTVSAVHDAVVLLDDSFSVISPRTFSPPPPPTKGSLPQIAKAAVFARKLTANQAQFKELGYLVGSQEHNYWRITIRCPSTENFDYGEVLARVKRTVVETLEGPDAVDVSNILVTGGLPVIYQAQQLMLTDLIHSFGLAFALVGVTLMLIFRSVSCGLICMIPNVLPCALAFGLMGYADIPIEIGTILTVCAALGIAVDDSMHFITWFRSGVKSGDSVYDSVHYAFRRCAFAMLQTTLICSFGLLVFGMSEFIPISKFGWCMFTLLILALVADVVVLPAILLTSLGRQFLPKDSADRAPTKKHETTSPIS